jgi:protein-S-isoprenylcysteine O-methyltransferase Ste14
VHPGLIARVALFTVFVPCTLALWGPIAIVTSRDFPPRGGLAAVAGVGLWLAGFGLYLSCARHFAVAGRGTPLPLAPPERLVVVGIYRHVRNPMYLGVLTAIAGWAVFFAGDNTLPLCVFWTAVVFHLMVVLYEEPALRRQFGESYEQYRRAVPRWIPRRTAWAGPAGGDSPAAG